MLKRDPEGYQKLLAYQKASALQAFTNEFILSLSKTKTFFDLADQMGRSGRSDSKNIVEGWKRNTTKEYFDFLGFSIGAIEELKDDAADIVTGVYPQLMGVKGVKGEKAIKREDLDNLPFYPMPPNLGSAVELFLRAKEVNFLLYKLQQSLDLKMDNEHTKPLSEQARNRFNTEDQADREFKKFMEDQGLVRLEDGRFIKKEV